MRNDLSIYPYIERYEEENREWTWTETIYLSLQKKFIFFYFLFIFLGIFYLVWGWDGAGWFSPAWLESGGGRGGNVLLLMGTREGKSMEAPWIIYTMFLSFPFSFSVSTKKNHSFKGAFNSWNGMWKKFENKFYDLTWEILKINRI